MSILYSGALDLGMFHTLPLIEDALEIRDRKPFCRDNWQLFTFIMYRNI